MKLFLCKRGSTVKQRRPVSPTLQEKHKAELCRRRQYELTADFDDTVPCVYTPRLAQCAGDEFPSMLPNVNRGNNNNNTNNSLCCGAEESTSIINCNRPSVFHTRCCDAAGNGMQIIPMGHVDCGGCTTSSSSSQSPVSHEGLNNNNNKTGAAHDVKGNADSLVEQPTTTVGAGTTTGYYMYEVLDPEQQRMILVRSDRPPLRSKALGAMRPPPIQGLGIW